MLIKTLYKLIQRVPQLKIVNGKKMESDRVYCDPEQIDSFYDRLEEILSQGIPSAFVINVDESGYCEWVDEIEISVDRNSKRASMMAGICADGSSLIPGVVIPRKIIEVELFENGYTEDKVTIIHQENWANTNFFPFIEAQREYYDYKGEAVVILDGFGLHGYNKFLDECTFIGIIVLPLPPHSSDQCQPLDLGIFHVQKGRMQRVYVDPKLSNRSNKSTAF